MRKIVKLLSVTAMLLVHGCSPGMSKVVVNNKGWTAVDKCFENCEFASINTVHTVSNIVVTVVFIKDGATTSLTTNNPSDK